MFIYEFLKRECCVCVILNIGSQKTVPKLVREAILNTFIHNNLLTKIENGRFICCANFRPRDFTK